MRHNDLIKKGDHIEWLSDKQTDRGPCCGTVYWIKDGVVCMRFGDTDFDHFKLEELEFIGVYLHARTNRPLFFAA